MYRVQWPMSAKGRFLPGGFPFGLSAASLTIRFRLRFSQAPQCEVGHNGETDAILFVICIRFTAFIPSALINGA